LISEPHHESHVTMPATSQRRFGLGAAVVLGIIAAIAAFRQAAPAWPIAFAALATLLAVMALAAPRALLPLQKAWAWLGWVLNWFNTRLLLSLVYFLMITPISLVLRLLGKDPMSRRWRQPGIESYWTQRSSTEAQDMRRQF
jgi:hypothetical protein